MSMLCTGLALGSTAARLISNAPHGVVVLAFVVFVALTLILPYLWYQRKHRAEPRQEVTRVDSVFGELRYAPEILYWLGRVWFPPLNREVFVDLGEDDEGLFARQRAWYQELERRYPMLQSEIEQLVQSTPRCSETFDRLQLDRINFPDEFTEDVAFALGYTSTVTHWAYWVSIEDWKPAFLTRVKKKDWKRIA